ncbi:MAG: hypothetical protein FWC02_01395 [Firmicutes bacterium]|nr:hypothetical protein [Bacillota bacterium]
MNSQILNEKISQKTKSRIRIYPQHNMRASSIGHDCERYLYFCVKNWEDRPPHDEGLQNIFDLGNCIEDYAINKIKEAGIEVLTPTENFKIEKPLISGRQDLMIKDPQDGQLYPVEIKGYSPIEYEKLNSIEDFFKSKRHYVRQTPAQLYCYMLKFGKEKGYFFLVNKLSGATKFIDATFDYDYAETLLQKAEKVYGALDVEKPETLNTTDDLTMCNDCHFKHLCTANKTRVEAEIDDGTIEDILNRKAELKPFKDEFDDLQDQLKAAVGEREKVITTDFVIERKLVKKKGFTVPDSEHYKIGIKRL